MYVPNIAWDLNLIGCTIFYLVALLPFPGLNFLISKMKIQAKFLNVYSCNDDGLWWSNEKNQQYIVCLHACIDIKLQTVLCWEGLPFIFEVILLPHESIAWMSIIFSLTSGSIIPNSVTFFFRTQTFFSL